MDRYRINAYEEPEFTIEKADDGEMVYFDEANARIQELEEENEKLQNENYQRNVYMASGDCELDITKSEIARLRKALEEIRQLAQQNHERRGSILRVASEALGGEKEKKTTP